MISCTFIKINDNVYNANCIKYINFGFLNSKKYDCHDLSGILIVFNDDMDLSPIRGYTHWPDIGQIFYDWSHNVNNLFEITVFDDEEAKRIQKKWEEKIGKS